LWWHGHISEGEFRFLFVPISLKKNLKLDGYSSMVELWFPRKHVEGRYFGVERLGADSVVKNRLARALKGREGAAIGPEALNTVQDHKVVVCT
jgi:hypothetical protein